MKNLAPEIFRQRLLAEGHYTLELDREGVEDFLLGLSRHLELRTYGPPVVYSPGADQGQAINQGFDAFVPLVDSGIAAYFWSQAGFFSIVIYSCKPFAVSRALYFMADYLKVRGEMAHQVF